MATSHSQSTSQQPSTLSLPDGLSADMVDTLPVLSAILSRLQNLSTTPAAPAASPPTPSPSQMASGTGPLTIKDIPAATDELKHKLQRARAQVKELPDIDRTAAEQEEEIRELEERISRQRDVLDQLRQAGIAAKRVHQATQVDKDAMET
jgi:small-conductance mechanosensitive channel